MKRILVADDSVTIQKVIALTFADEPCEVKSVGTGTEALEVIRTWKPDILLADVIMPQMNGYELCRAVKDQPETASVPVLLLAGTFEAFDGDEAKSVGADDYITKPFESVELIEKVNLLTDAAPSVAPAPEDQEEVFVPEPSPPEASATEKEPVPEPFPPTGEEPVPEPAPPVFSTPSSESPGEAAVTESQEPDIWDILSDVDDLSPEPTASPAEEETPGLGPLEDQVVVDVGSFDVGISRPEPVPAPPEPRPEAETGPPVFSPEPLVPPSGQMPPEDVVVPPVAESPDIAPEKSRVEDREKDFFGFETEGLETVAEGDILGDAVEEITFEMEEPSSDGGEADREASFIVPEPPADVSLETGETVHPESMGFEIPETVVPEPTLTDSEEAAPEFVAESVPEEPTAIPEISLLPEPSLPEEESPPGMVPEPPAATPLELMTEPPPLDVPGDPSALEEAQIRKIVEEKAEKIVWEIVPELAEIMIREALEKIKGGS